ncbi:hypothetical protein HQ590_10840 [bacterium]|nr:hypothetical protein [bacterium]
MTSKERTLAILNHQPVDRLPFCDCVVNDAVFEHYSGETLTVENGRRVVLKAMDNFLDATRWIIMFPQKEETIAGPDGTTIEQRRWTAWHQRKFELTEDDAVQMLRRATEEEAARDVAQAAAEFDAWIGGSLTQLRNELQNTFLFGNYWFKTGVMFYATVGLELFSYVMADHPEVLDDYLRIGNRGRLEVIKRSQRAGDFPAIFMCEDIASKNGPLFSPEFLRQYFYPHLEAMVDAYHQHGIKFIFHSDGNIMPILDDLVATGIDGLNPLETIAGVDLKQVRKRHPELILLGGIDCSQLLPFGTTNDVRRVTRQAMQDAGPWYFPGSTSEIHNNIPLDNVKAMIDEVHAWTL